MGNIYLVGIMGVGKTTIGRKLAQLLGLPFVDTDHELEHRTGVTVGHIFDIEGEAGFRMRESALLHELAAEFRGVVATGGGMVTEDKNRELMASTGKVVYLKASFSTLWMRLKNNTTRPLLQTENPKARLKHLLQEREALYQSLASHTVKVGRGSAMQMAKRIQQQLNEDT